MICGKSQKEQENNQIHEIGHFEKNSKNAYVGEHGKKR